MIRGLRCMAVAVRRPDGSIAVRAERLSRLYTGAARRLPLLRGVVALTETLALGVRALTWSAAVASDEVDEHGEALPLGVLAWTALALTMLVAIAVFFAGPVLLTAWLDGVLPAGWLVVAVEGLLRVALLLGYIWAIGRSAEVRRVFRYHGAEHMTIHAFEHGAIDADTLGDGRERHVPVVRRFDRAHPRCGTSFLLTVAVISVFVFVLLGTPPLWWRLLSRLLLIPLIAALAYEAIRWAGRHPDLPIVRWLFAGNMALQRLTTGEPDGRAGAGGARRSRPRRQRGPRPRGPCLGRPRPGTAAPRTARRRPRSDVVRGALAVPSNGYARGGTRRTAPCPCLSSSTSTTPRPAPAGDKETGGQLLPLLASAPQAGVTIRAEAVVDGEHELNLIADAESAETVQQFMTPFGQMGSVTVRASASTPSPCSRPEANAPRGWHAVTFATPARDWRGTAARDAAAESGHHLSVWRLHAAGD